jgi:MFS family permease
MKKKISAYPKYFWSALVIFSLTGQIAWVIENMYFNVFIYKMFGADPASISLMVAASAIAATLTTIIIGPLSDKIGKRKLFISAGYILWGVSILCFAFIRKDIIQSFFPTFNAISVGVSLVIIMDCVMTFFGSTANDACFNAWLTDSTESSGRGAAEGINSMMPLMAILVVVGGFMAFDLNKPESWTTIVLVIGAVVIVIGILGFWIIKESYTKNEENKSYFKNIIYGFKPSVIKNNKVLYITLLAFAVFGISIQIFMPYLILYYNVSLGLENYVLIMAPAIILAAVMTAIYGKVYDKKGFKKSIIPSLILLALGYILLIVSTHTALVFVGSLLMMCGYLSGMAVFGAMIRDYTPKGKAGMFQGLRIIGQVLIPGVIGPAIGAAVLKNAQTVLNDDGTTSFIPNQNIFIAALLVLAVLIAVLIIEFTLLKKEKNNV